MPDSHISEAMRKGIDRQVTRGVSFPVSESDIRRWALAVYYPESPPREFWDSEYASRTQFGGIVAPAEFNPFAWMVAEPNERGVDVDPTSPDQYELLLGIPGPGLKTGLNAGMEVEYGVPIRPGDVITDVLRLASYDEREGRMGLMLFTTIEDIWTNQNDEVVKRSRQHSIRY